MATNSNVWILCAVLIGALLLCFILGYITTSTSTMYAPTPYASTTSNYSFGYMFFLGLVLFMLGVLSAYMWGQIKWNDTSSTTTTNTTNVNTRLNNDKDNQKYAFSMPSWFGEKYVDKPDNAKSKLDDYNAREDKYAQYTLSYS